MAVYAQTPSGQPRRWSASEETLRAIDIDLVHFYSDGCRLAGHLYKPKEMKSEDKRPGIVLIHGFTGIKEVLLPPYAEAFAKEGWVALTFDFRGFGESDGPQRGRLFWDDQVEDAINAVTFLRCCPGVDEERLGVWGTSYGGALSAYVLAVDWRAKVGVAQLGFADGGTMLQRLPEEAKKFFLQRIEEDRRRRVLHNDPGYAPMRDLVGHPGLNGFFEEAKKDYPQLHDREIPVEFYEKHVAFSPISVIERKGNKPLLFIAGSKDDLTPAADFRTLYDRAPEPKKWFELDCGHFEVYEGEFGARGRAEAVAFFKQYL